MCLTWDVKGTLSASVLARVICTIHTQPNQQRQAGQYGYQCPMVNSVKNQCCKPTAVNINHAKHTNGF